MKVHKGTKVTIGYKDLVTDVAPEVRKAINIEVVKQP